MLEFIKKNKIIILVFTLILIVITLLIFSTRKTNTYEYKMICKLSYEYGETFKVEAEYNKDKEAENIFIKHQEDDLEDDSLECAQMDSQKGITCNISGKENPQTMKIRMNISEFDEKSYQLVKESDISKNLVFLNLDKAKEYLVTNGLECNVYNSKDELIEEVITTEYYGEYYTKDENSHLTFKVELYEDNTYQSLVNFGIETVPLKGIYEVDGQTLILKSSKENGYSIEDTKFLISNNKITYMSGGIDDTTRENIGCKKGYFDCQEETIYYMY